MPGVLYHIVPAHARACPEAAGALTWSAHAPLMEPPMSRVVAAVTFLAVCGLAAALYAQDDAPVGAEGAAAVPAKGEAAEAEPSDVPAGQNAVPYPEEVRSEFMRACIESGGPDTVCTCVLDRMEAAWTVEQLGNNEVNIEWINTETDLCLEPYLQQLMAEPQPGQ